MPWGGGRYTRTNQTYNGDDVWQEDAANAFNIEADRHDLHDSDLADGINDTLHRYGENAMGSNLKMGGNKVTDMGNATNSNEAVNKGQMDSAIDQAVAPGSRNYAMIRWNGTKWEEDPVANILDGAMSGITNITMSGDLDGAVNITASGDIAGGGDIVGGGGSLLATGEFTITGGITANGDLDVGVGAIAADGSITGGGGSLAANGDLTVNGGIDAGGDITTTENLSVTGTSTLTGAVTAPGGITGDVTGTSSSWDAPVDISLTGDATGTVAIDGTDDVSMAVDVVDSLRANGWLLAIVGSLPGTPDAATLYFTTDTVNLNN